MPNYSLRLHNKKDADIIRCLSAKPNVNHFIKKAIRNYIENFEPYILEELKKEDMEDMEDIVNFICCKIEDLYDIDLIFEEVKKNIQGGII